MQILSSSFTYTAPLLDRFWARVKGTWLAPLLSHPMQAPFAADLLAVQASSRHGTRWAPSVAEALLAAPLRGAGYGWESRRWLVPAAGDATDFAMTAANGINYNVYDFFAVTLVGLVWTVTGTTTALVLYFDLYTQANGAGTKTAGLTGTQADGTITAPSTASQAAGNVLYKDFADTIDAVSVSPGNSVQALVNTGVTAGHGLPIILGITRAETMANLSTASKSS